MINKANLKKQIQSIVGQIIYERGLHYFSSRHVKSINITDSIGSKILITGVVSGTEDYNCDTIFNLENNKFGSFECDCPYNFDCKHSTALALHFIEHYDDFIQQRNGFDYLTEIDSLSNFIEYNRDKNNKGMKYLSEEPRKPKERVLKKKKFDINDYYLCLSGFTGGFLDVELNNKNSHNNFFPSYHISDIIRESENSLTKTQRRFFEALGDNDYSGKKNGLILELAGKIGVDVYKGRNLMSDRMNFIKDGNKIEAELNLEKGYNEFREEEDSKFLFKVPNKYRGSKFILGDNGIVEITGKHIIHHDMSQRLASVLERINLLNIGGHYNHKYSFIGEESFSVILRQDEVLDINIILKEAKKYLNFKSNIVGDFNIVESKKNNPAILIDYDSEKNKLNAITVMDYGFEKVPVAETVFYSNSRNNKGYQRRDYYRGWDNYVLSIKDGVINYAHIDKKGEARLFRKIHESDGYYGFGKFNRYSAGSFKKINEFAQIYLPRIKKLGYPIEFTKDTLDFSDSEFKANFDVDMDKGKDWLYFDVDCYCGEDKVVLDDLISFVKNKEDFLRLKDGRLLNVTNKDELERFVYMLESFYLRENNKGFKGRLYNAPELEDIFTSSKHYSSRVASGFNKFMSEIKSGKPVKKVNLPLKISKKLRDYQIEGIDWLYFLRKYRFAGVLADDMGLGKTFQALVLIQKEKIEGKPSLVVCPKTLLYNWQEESEKFTPGLKTVVVDGNASERKKIIEKANEFDLVIASYSSLKNDLDKYKENNLKFNYFVIDEAQFIKNHKTKTAQAVKKIDADYRLALTGTPLENSVSEIWSVFEFLMPGFLGSNKSFVQKFQNPIMKNNNADALKHLRKKIECFMLRRTKSEVLKELPPKIEQVSHCHLGKEQNLLYQEILKNVKKDVLSVVNEKGFAKSQIHILAALTKLRQVCNHPVLLLKDKDYKQYESAKLELFMELVKEISESGRKVLVFSQFTTMLDILGKELDEENINYLYLSGKTKNRQDVVKAFNKDKKHSVFLISLKAGGTGLNLTSADNVIIFDPWWNPSVENQAIDRAHRMGQKNSVNVYRLITQGTIEEKIVELQEKKKFLFDNMVGETKDLFQKLTWDDIKNIFE